ncbi:MAG: hypothetical protein IJX90_10030 [Blautia sp.]|nr:hypothetical protein [Blautia sp.]
MLAALGVEDYMLPGAIESTTPMVVPLSFEGVETNEDGMIAEDDLMELFESAIDAFPEIEEKYAEQELADAA